MFSAFPDKSDTGYIVLCQVVNHLLFFRSHGIEFNQFEVFSIILTTFSVINFKFCNATINLC
jgi:hypothetical protein